MKLKHLMIAAVVFSLGPGNAQELEEPEKLPDHPPKDAVKMTSGITYHVVKKGNGRRPLDFEAAIREKRTLFLSMIRREWSQKDQISPVAIKENDSSFEVGPYLEHHPNDGSLSAKLIDPMKEGEIRRYWIPRSIILEESNQEGSEKEELKRTTRDPCVIEITLIKIKEQPRLKKGQRRIILPPNPDLNKK